MEDSDSDSSEDVSDTENTFAHVTTLNNIRKELDLAEIEFGRRNNAGKQSLIRKSLEEVQQKLQTLFHLKSSKSENETRFEQILDRVRQKVKASSRRMKIKLLSLFSGILTQNEVMEEFGVSNRAARIASKLYQSEGVFSEPPMKKGRPLDDEIATAVTDFYQDDEYSRISPNQKDTKFESGKAVQKRNLLMTLTELHGKFILSHPDKKISLSKFTKMRPSHCELLGSFKKDVCVCIYHDNLEMLFDAIGITKYTIFLEKLTCGDKENGKSCMYRRCLDCKEKTEPFVTSVMQHIEEKKPQFLELGVKFNQWVRNGGRDSQVTYVMTVEEYLDFLLNHCVTVLKHHLVTKAQFRFQKYSKLHLNESTVMIQCDFSENYGVEYRKEIQSLYYDRPQTTLHPFVVTARKEGSIVTKHVVLISDDLDHVTNVYFAFQTKMLAWLKSEYPVVTNVMYFTDGAASQYKNYKNFTNIFYHARDFGITASHHFFASCHGKGPCDGIGGVTKSKVRRAALGGQLIDSPLKFYEFVKENMKSVHPIFITKEEIHEIIDSRRLAERYAASTRMPQIRQVHKVITSSDSKSLELYELSSDHEPCATVKINCSDIFLDCACIEVGEWVAAWYEKQFYYGKVLSVDLEEEELEIHFFKERADTKSSFTTWDLKPIFVPFGHIIDRIPSPKTQGRKFIFPSSTKDIVEAKIHAQASN